MEPVTWLRPEYQGREDELIHLAAGAELVGVTRSAVSNWAARHANFPRIVMLTGLHGPRIKYVVRDEFLAFAQQQLNKPRGRRQHAGRPSRPRAVIRAGEAAHWEKQIERLTSLEARQAAALTRTRGALREARSNLQIARAALAVEVEAVQCIADNI
jgi:hypothetical protein